MLRSKIGWWLGGATMRLADFLYKNRGNLEIAFGVFLLIAAAASVVVVMIWAAP